MKGYDYTVQATANTRGMAVDRTLAEWQALLRQAIKDGGRRRVEHGETFIHAKGSRIIAEIYGYLPKEDIDKHGREITCI